MGMSANINSMNNFLSLSRMFSTLEVHGSKRLVAQRQLVIPFDGSISAVLRVSIFSRIIKVNSRLRHFIDKLVVVFNSFDISISSNLGLQVVSALFDRFLYRFEIGVARHYKSTI